MASIIQAASEVVDAARDGISWIYLYKKGRSWFSGVVYGVDYDERTNSATLDFPEDLEELKQILDIDCNAIMVNSWYHNLGVCEEYVSVNRLADFLKWQYENNTFTLDDFINGILDME